MGARHPLPAEGHTEFAARTDSIAHERASRIIPSRRILCLTHVTRIFQKSVFTKAAPSSPGDTRPGLFCCAPRGHIAHESTSTFGCGMWPRAEFHCLRIVIYNEFCNSSVLPARALFSARAKR